jgi:uncharacterized membrane protein YvbJ
MRYCNNCGEKIADDAKFCPSCGTKFAEQSEQPKQETYQPPVQDGTQQPPVQDQTQQPNAGYNPYDQLNNNYYQQTQADKPSGKINTGLLVWSIINTVLCCQILGIIALIMTITANSTSTAQEENKKLGTAKTLNLIGTIGGVIIVVFYIVLLAAGALDTYLNF